MSNQDKGKSPFELIQQLKAKLESLEKDAKKASRGMKAGGVRLRSEMQTVRQMALGIRESVLNWRRTAVEQQDQRERKKQVEHKGLRPRHGADHSDQSKKSFSLSMNPLWTGETSVPLSWANSSSSARRRSSSRVGTSTKIRT